jgi:tRNA(Ile)-lysidine synthase
VVETRRLTDLLARALDGLEVPPGPVTVALSGGADSAALALLVKRSGAGVDCLHVDHGLPASPKMAAAAAGIAGALELSLETVEVTPVPGPSPEDRAREARYSVLETWPGPVLTGHTRDDNAETMLINLVRGSGPDGLTGIPSFRSPNIHRPILRMLRSETREMASLAGLPFVDDPMNSDLALTRNRIRHSILPLLRELNPRIVESLTRAAETLDRDTSYLRALAPVPQGPSVAVGLVMTLPRPLADRLLASLLRSCGVEVTSDRLGRVWSVARGESQSQQLGDGRVVRRRGALVEVNA